MASNYLQAPDGFELASRTSVESLESFNLDDADFETMPLRKRKYLDHRRDRLWNTFTGLLPQPLRQRLVRTHRRDSTVPKPFFHHGANSGRVRRRRSLSRKLCAFSHIFVVLLAALIILTGYFRPSYSSPPERYQKLRTRVEATQDQGRGNPNHQRIFIAASLYDRDGALVGGTWGESVLQLVDLLGWGNVFLSVYTNGGPKGEEALRKFGEKVNCQKELVYEENLDREFVPPIRLPDGDEGYKRTAFLAHVRNKALRPFEEHPDVRYDRLLYLNDVVFDPIDALHLLFSTNGDENDKAYYRAACAVDFINPFKFYDTFATRDLEGYSMGLPFYPWFTSSGKHESRSDVLAQKDAIRVRSCWGGMVAFDAHFFQQDLQKTTAAHDLPEVSVTRFRAEEDLFWDSSECCLINADIGLEPTAESRDSGIFMNPYVRVAYDQKTFSWLSFTRRYERLYSIPHTILNHLVGLPWHNPRRTEKIGEKVTNKVWVPGPHGRPHEGKFELVERIAKPGGFCGRRNLQVMRKDPKEGEKNWVEFPVPPHLKARS